ncbi:unnamed protein product, partial [Brenthis ino]
MYRSIVRVSYKCNDFFRRPSPARSVHHRPDKMFAVMQIDEDHTRDFRRKLRPKCEFVCKYCQPARFAGRVSNGRTICVSTDVVNACGGEGDGDSTINNSGLSYTIEEIHYSPKKQTMHYR